MRRDAAAWIGQKTSQICDWIDKLNRKEATRQLRHQLTGTVPFDLKGSVAYQQATLGTERGESTSR